MSDFVTEVERTARRPHVCWLCEAETIKRGDRYLSVWGVSNRQWFRYKECLPCGSLVLAVQRWADPTFCESFCIEDVREYAENYPNNPRVRAWRERRKERVSE